MNQTPGPVVSELPDDGAACTCISKYHFFAEPASAAIFELPKKVQADIINRNTFEKR